MALSTATQAAFDAVDDLMAAWTKFITVAMIPLDEASLAYGPSVAISKHLPGISSSLMLIKTHYDTAKTVARDPVLAREWDSIKTNEGRAAFYPGLASAQANK